MTFLEEVKDEVDLVVSQRLVFDHIEKDLFSFGNNFWVVISSINLIKNRPSSNELLDSDLFDREVIVCTSSTDLS